MRNDMLPSDIINWIKSHMNPDTVITDVTRLKGSTSSTLHRITMTEGTVTKNAVLRQFDNEEWSREEPDLVIHEAASLTAASLSSVPTPDMIAGDETGGECGVPVILMSYLNGHVELLPADWTQWLRELALALVRIHDVAPYDFPYRYYRYQDIKSFDVPIWSSTPDKWEEALAYIQKPAPDYEPHFIHRDYHPANVLWENGVISGVVDWVNACVGPRGVDVGHARVNLAQLYDVETADAFLNWYSSINEDFTYEPYWDIVSLIDILFGSPEVYPGWKAFGVTGLTDEMMVERLDKYVSRLVELI